MTASLLPMDARSQAARAGLRNVWPVLSEGTVWWPSRAMTRSQYRAIAAQLRRFRNDDVVCLSFGAAAMLGLDSDDDCPGDADVYDVDDVRARLAGDVPLSILDAIGNGGAA